MQPTNHTDQGQKSMDEPAAASEDICKKCKAPDVEKTIQLPQTVMGTIDHTADAANREWDLSNTKIIPVPADGLCMYHCVHAAGDPDWMENRHPSGTSLDWQRERVDATRARALRKRFIKFLADK